MPVSQVDKTRGNFAAFRYRIENRPEVCTAAASRPKLDCVLGGELINATNFRVAIEN